MKLVLAVTMLALAACGADGEPEPVTPKTGVSISGRAEIGVRGTL